MTEGTPMTGPEPTRARWRSYVAPSLVVLLPLALFVAGELRGRAQAQGKEDSPARAQAAPGPHLELAETVLSPEQEKALDVKTVPARRVRGDHPMVTGGKVSLDLEHTARVRPLLNSIIYEVRKRAGDVVKKGDELLVVESTDLGDAKNNYLSALANLEVAAETYRREALIRVGQGTTETDYHNARAAFRTAAVTVEAAREKCLLLGVSARELDALEQELPLAPGLKAPPGEPEKPEELSQLQLPSEKERRGDAEAALREIARRRVHRGAAGDEDTRRRARYTIRAPIDGVLIAKDAARGEYVDPSQIIATVSDLSQLWINVDVYQKDIPKVRIGARVDVYTPTYPDTAFVGSVTFLSESVDDTTHTLRARVVVDNSQRLLKSGMAAKTVVHCADEKPEIELPPDAILREGEETFVVVKKAQGRFERRKVRLGFEAEDAVHIEGGLSEGDEVVVEGNLFIHTKIPLGD